MVTSAPPWAAIPVPDHSLREEAFPHVQPKPPLVQLAAISPGPVCCLGEEAKPLFTTTSLQEVVECNEVCPEPPLLQTKQSQLPQPLIIDLCSRPLTSFVALLWTCPRASMSFL